MQKASRIPSVHPRPAKSGAGSDKRCSNISGLTFGLSHDGFTGIGKIRNSRNAPERVIKLENEITDLKLVISVVQDFEERDQPLHNAAARHLVVALNNAKKAVLDLQSLIEYSLKKSSDGNVSRKAWMRMQTRVEELSGNIRSSRQDIGTAVSIENR